MVIDIERLLRVPYVDSEGGFDISPDGRHIAFSWNITGRWEIYELGLISADEPELISAGRGGKLAPRYSPDGSRLAYAVDFDGGENFHIFIYDRNTCEQKDMTPGIDFAIQRYFCWSPDGLNIAFLANRSGCFSTYIMTASSGEYRLLLDNGFPALHVSWSPDGAYLATMCEARGQDYYVYIIPIDGNGPFLITDEHGPINAHTPAWSPDGTKLAFQSDASNGLHQIGIFDVGSRQVTWLTNEQANHRTPVWSQDGSYLAYVRAQGAADTIVTHRLAGEAQAFQVETGVHYRPQFTPDGKQVILIFNNPRYPPDLWMFDRRSSEFRQLTSSLPVDMYAAPFRLPEEISYPGLDGASIPALLFKAENASNATPAVVIIHGGPGWHFQVEWYPFMSHLASLGWTVLAPNYRGSTGYGRNWQWSNRFNLGGVDTDDVAAGVRYLLDEGIADPSRIAVTGRSHGGYLTMSCLTRYPELWCAGSAVVPFLNWFTAHENSREDLQHWDLENFGNPRDNYDLWYERSPFYFLDKVNASVQLICAENDPRCPASESAQARDRLLELGKEVDFHLYLGEGHAFLKTENVVDAEVRRVEFLAKALE